MPVQQHRREDADEGLIVGEAGGAALPALLEQPADGHRVEIARFADALRIQRFGDVIQRHLDSDAVAAPAPIMSAPTKARPRFCPHCSAGALVRTEGCDKCLECGYSKCS